MITILTENYNTISPKKYNDILSSIEFTSLACSCGHSGCLIKHGFYNRTVKIIDDKIIYHIQRVLCSCCGTTHALLHSSMVPYSQICLKHHLTIISSQQDKSKLASLMHSCSTFDESTVSYILSQFRKYWEQRLLSQSIDLANISISQLISQCFRHYSRQFMQIRSTKNILFQPPHSLARFSFSLRI